ncbi:type II toxin-antitoxin system prevent-host-death family antitoxin [Micromonospora sp. NPDC047074]|uniref:type II toxin-antitoxin system Phd/YefM family antitoxin n=1 Tax=Micromonospora sp. NPDC047074 TaxID=3154339 RepID=UPI0033DBFD28
MSSKDCHRVPEALNEKDQQGARHWVFCDRPLPGGGGARWRSTTPAALAARAAARPRLKKRRWPPRLRQRYNFLYLQWGAIMRTVNFTQLRQNLAAELDSVINDAEEVVVTRSGHEPVVIVPLAEYEAMKETEYLLRNPSNAAALRRSIAELDQGAAVERKLIDPADVRDVA